MRCILKSYWPLQNIVRENKYGCSGQGAAGCLVRLKFDEARTRGSAPPFLKNTSESKYCHQPTSQNKERAPKHMKKVIISKIEKCSVSESLNWGCQRSLFLPNPLATPCCSIKCSKPHVKSQVGLSGFREMHILIEPTMHLEISATSR